MGLKTSANLTKTFADLEKQIKDTSAKFIKQTILDTHNTILVKSPVDSGIYRASNFIGVDADSDEVATSSTARSYEGLDVDDRPRKYIFYNNVPYAERLENGHSQQAPDGIYYPSALAMREFIRRNGGEFAKIKIKAKK